MSQINVALTGSGNIDSAHVDVIRMQFQKLAKMLKDLGLPNVVAEFRPSPKLMREASAEPVGVVAGGSDADESLLGS